MPKEVFPTAEDIRLVCFKAVYRQRNQFLSKHIQIEGVAVFFSISQEPDLN